MMNNEVSDSGNNGNPNLGLLGDFLKEKRLEKNYSLEKLSQKTKISVNILKALESNDYKSLPSAAYIKGFVTSYVKVLGLDITEAINKMEYTYLNVHGKPFPALNHTKSMPKAAQPSVEKVDGEEAQEVIESSDSIIQSTKSLLPVIILGSVILLFIGGYKIISSVIESEVNDQKDKDMGPVIESSSALVNPHIQKTTSKPAEAKPSEAAAPVSAEVPAAAPAETKPAEPEFQRNFPTVEFKKIRGPLFSIKREAEENNDEALLPPKIKDAMNPDLQNVYIHAVDGNTWLSYKVDEKPITSIIISKGGELFIQGNSIRIFLGNVNVTKIFYNNYLIDTPTKNGVKTLVFPEENNEKYLMPIFPKAKDDVLYTSEDYIKRMTLEEEELKKRQGN